MKNTTILNLIIILGIVLSGFYLISKSNNQSDDVNNTNEIAITTELISLDTSDWQTCRNEEYGYEFKYPKNWHMYNSEESYGEESPVIEREGENCIGSYLFVSLKAVDYENKGINSSLGIKVKNQEDLSTTVYAKSKSLEDYFNKATADFREAHSIEKKSMIDNKEVWWEKTKNGYVLWLFNKEDLIQVHLEEITAELSDIILSTLKFIH